MWPFSSKSYPVLTAADVGVRVPVADGDLSSCTYDYIIVGGGTAGCCLASRLSENPDVSVLLVERGDVFDQWKYTVPLISADCYSNDTIAKKSQSLPITHADNLRATILQPEALGGASRVNAMIYTRGLPADYNQWSELGHPEWSYDKMIPYFIKSETSLSQPRSNFRGVSGPWENQTFLDYPFSINHYVKKAATQIGIPFVPDFNSPLVPSVSCAALDIATDRKMQRASSYSAFLPQSLAIARKSHLKICTNTIVPRVVLKSSSGSKPRAIGVELMNNDKRSSPGSLKFFARARREVILCCGALGSPQLLMLSGIGPEKHLNEHGIKVIVSNDGVGANLKDHIDLPVMGYTPINDNIFVLTKKPWKAGFELLKYLLSSRSLLSFPIVYMAIFLPTRLLNNNMEIVDPHPGDLDCTLPQNLPDIEVKPMAIQGSVASPRIPDGQGIFTFMVCLIRPKSTGTVRLKSADPYDRPMCDLGFYTAQEDVETHRKGVRLALRLMEQIRAQGYPMTNCRVPTSESDEDIDAFVRTYAQTTYHYGCSCRMAPYDSPIPGVVDDELRVHGVDGLRICDASIFPELVAAHTMAPVVATAEKCADMIKETYLNSAKNI